jgi:hypothetical protein
LCASPKVKKKSPLEIDRSRKPVFRHYYCIIIIIFGHARTTYSIIWTTKGQNTTTHPPLNNRLFKPKTFTTLTTNKKMAAPSTVSTADLSGTYTLNSKLSDPMDAVLKMQGVGWLVRQAAAYSTVTCTMKQYVRDGAVCLDVDQVSTGGIRSKEERVLNWEWREKDDRIWGKVRGRAR